MLSHLQGYVGHTALKLGVEELNSAFLCNLRAKIRLCERFSKFSFFL